MLGIMKAAVVRAFREPLQIEEVPIPAPGPGEVLVKVVAIGVCHTDVHAADGDWPAKPTLPFIPGHEGVGIFASVGAGVKGPKEGDPVGVAWLHDTCGGCEYCITGWEILCEAQHNSGYSVNGSFAEYSILYRPSAAQPRLRRDGADPLRRGDTYKGIKEIEAWPGEWLAISGIGGLDHIAIQYTKAMDLHVAALDVSEDKLVLARHTGTELAVNARAPEAAAQVVKRTRGGAHGVLMTRCHRPHSARPCNWSDVAAPSAWLGCRQGSSRRPSLTSSSSGSRCTARSWAAARTRPRRSSSRWRVRSGRRLRTPDWMISIRCPPGCGAVPSMVVS